MSTQANDDDRTYTLELNDYNDLDDLEWALSMARHSMTKKAREAGRARDVGRREAALDARNTFDRLQDLVAEAKMDGGR